MKVLNIAWDDYANFSHSIASALRAVGVECDDVKIIGHAYNYAQTSRIVTDAELADLIRLADLIQVMHSDPALISLCKGKRTVVWHTGTRYRQNPEKFNRIFNPRVERCFIALGEFAGLGAKRETYCCGPVDTDAIRPGDGTNQRLVIAHYPSNPGTKGTAVINEVIKELTGDFEYRNDPYNLPHQEHLERMRACDIYVELLAPEQNGKPYGSFGITGLEAMAMNKVLITQAPPLYEKTYGPSPLTLIKTREDLRAELQGFINSGDGGPITRAWALQNHSYRATGARIKAILGI